MIRQVSPHHDNWLIPSLLIALMLAVVSGTLTTHMFFSILPVGIAAGLLVGFTIPLVQLQRLFLITLVLLLIGYLFQGRNFAYLGIPPLFIGEMVLALAILTATRSAKSVRIDVLKVMLAAFMLLSLVRTIPYLSEDGLFAIRDASVWYYALFAFIVAALLTERNTRSFISLFSQLCLPLAVWYIAYPVIYPTIRDILPKLSASGAPIIYLSKPGDRAVVLTAIGVFVLLRVWERFGISVRFPTSIFWLAWIGAAIIVATSNRGGMLALVVAMGVTQYFYRSKEYPKLLLILAALALVFIVVDPSIDVGGYRKLSLDQLQENVTSIFSDNTEDSTNTAGSKRFRELLWSAIWEDNTSGSRKWTGLGYGANILDHYGFNLDAAKTVRAPHNTHITVLARTGLPGFTLWICFHLVFAWQMTVSILRAKKVQSPWAPVLVWLLAIWAASMVNTSFDPYLEGPQGAIPFWCAVGAGIAVMRFVREDAEGATSQFGAVHAAHHPRS